MQEMVNKELSTKVPESIGDCGALRSYRQKAGITGYDHAKCVGNKELANKTTGSVHVEAKWITGLDTIRLTRLRLLPPQNPDAPSQTWNFDVDGELTDLHVWLKVALESTWISKVWFDDNMCCTNPFHFKIRASAECEQGRGFHRIEMDLPKLDPIELKHSVDQGDQGYYETNYGSVSVVQDALRNIFKKTTSQVRVEVGGTIEDPMSFIRDKMQQVVQLNTGQSCPSGEKFRLFDPTPAPTSAPTSIPSQSPTATPTSFPTAGPTVIPTAPTQRPTSLPPITQVPSSLAVEAAK